MTRYAPPVRRVARGRGHVYEDANGLRVPSVTGIIGDGVPKPALIDWAANSTADYAVNNWDDLARMAPAARLKRLQKARYEDRDTAANRGTAVHHLGEQLVAGGDVAIPDELAGHAESYVQFLDDWEPQPILIETVVMSHRHGYAGTLDLAAEIVLPDLGEVLALLDVKTSRSGIFGETALQLAAYRHADVYVDADGAEQPMPEFGAVLGLHVRGDGYSLLPIEAGPVQLREFLYAREVGRFAKETSRGYIGEPLTPPRLVTRRRLEVVNASEES